MVVEAAIVLPAMIFLLLLTIQLTQLQQARIMVEYAAYAAARTGIVMNGDNGNSNGISDGKMKEAAVMAVLPTFGRTDSFAAYAKTLARFRLQEAVMSRAGIPMVRVQVLNPVQADFATYGGHLNGQEIDFDDVRPGSNGAPGATEATLLSIQVRYLYEMHVPFANRMIQTIWMASKANVLRSWQGWDLTSPRVGSQRGADAVAISRGVAATKVVPDGTPEGIRLAGLVAAGLLNRYYLPVEAFYTMRMQSNPYRKWAHP